MTLTAEAVAAYLSRLWDAPVAIEALARIPGGASRQTYRFDAVVGDERRPLILRRDPGGSLIDTESETEFRAYQSAAGTVPVPAAVALERDGAELERPFFIMQRIDGGEVAGAFTREPFGEHGEALGRQFFTALGRLAALDPAGTPLAAHLPTPAPDEAWRVALDYWEGVLDEDELVPNPLVRAAIRRLRANPPPPAPAVRIVHGDYRSGNVMHDGAGNMLAMLDWEMAHLGDPHEDLGWALDPIWYHFSDRVCGMCSRDQAIAAWEAASGMTVDPAALDWWALFNSIKGRAIWTSAFKEFVDGGRTDPVLGLSGWYTAVRQDAIIAERLAPEADAGAPLGAPTTQLSDILIGAGIVASGAGAVAAEADAFGGTMVSIAGILAILSAQEAEKAAAWRVADIAAMRDLLGDATDIARADTMTLSALDREWSDLSRALIDRHAAAERDGDTAFDRAALAFYRISAARRELVWPA